jgi:hypothetical protein
VPDPEWDDYLNLLVANTPECWDGDEDESDIALTYLRHLEAEVIRLGGSTHKFEDCSCA